MSSSSESEGNYLGVDIADLIEENRELKREIKQINEMISNIIKSNFEDY